jgi:hypothetical protein
VLAGAGATAIAAAGVFGGIAIAGGGSDDRDLDRVVVAKPITATVPGPTERGPAGSTIQTFYLADLVVPPANSGTVVGPRCPTGAGGAIGGGAATQQGIVISYLSQLRPTNNATAARIYYVGVDDNSRTNGTSAGATVEVHCAKGITVRK